MGVRVPMGFADRLENRMFQFTDLSTAALWALSAAAVPVPDAMAPPAVPLLSSDATCPPSLAPPPAPAAVVEAGTGLVLVAPPAGKLAWAELRACIASREPPSKV
mmetsp:Transcript_28506/g.58894  ORF Transcript_28506/g.58894 Transcript_28506/m.58894 type:complete len:105 (-) Transcript_28506:78-392(-)